LSIGNSADVSASVAAANIAAKAASGKLPEDRHVWKVSSTRFKCATSPACFSVVAAADMFGLVW